MDSKNQKLYFDKQNNRYKIGLLKHPPKRQLLEYQQMETELKLPIGSKLMDFGSGNGRVALYFLGRGYHVHAVDVSKTSLLELTKIYKQIKTSSWGVLTTSTTLPTTPVFDGIVGADILHHVDIHTILPQLKKTVKKNGVLVFSEPNGWNPLWYIYIFLKRLPWSIEKNIIYTNPLQITCAFQRSGYTDIHIKNIYFFTRMVIHGINKE